MNTQFKKGFTPWNKGKKGIHLSPKTEFKKGDNKVDLNIRFWQKVRKTKSCWLWVGSKNNKGYGRINIDGKVELAHRISYEIENGKILNKLNVLHKCDTPLCIKPKHLFLGTKKDNSQDMTKKGRGTSGEKAIFAKLTWGKVKEIRSLYPQGGWTHRSLAKKYNISQAIITNILNNKRWRI